MTRAERRLKYATGLLELWLQPMKLECPASGHNGGRAVSCTCRDVEIKIRTREFLGGLRKSSGGK